jgi:hypothetical protein
MKKLFNLAIIFCCFIAVSAYAITFKYTSININDGTHVLSKPNSLFVASETIDDNGLVPKMPPFKCTVTTRVGTPYPLQWQFQRNLEPIVSLSKPQSTFMTSSYIQPSPDVFAIRVWANLTTINQPVYIICTTYGS